MPRPSSSPATDIWRKAAGVLGFVVLLTGVVLAAMDRDGGPVVAVIVTGALLFVSPLLLHRLREFSVGPDGVTFGLVTEVAQTAPETAAVLGRTDLAGLAEAYAIVHAELPGPDNKRARSAVEDVLLRRAAATARLHAFNAEEVRALFRDGSPVIRVLALGLMEGDPSLADAGTIGDAIGRSRSGNEQYHGLKLADLSWRRLTPVERSAILEVVDQAGTMGPDRAALARTLRERQS